MLVYIMGWKEGRLSKNRVLLVQEASLAERAEECFSRLGTVWPTKGYLSSPTSQSHTHIHTHTKGIVAYLKEADL